MSAAEVLSGAARYHVACERAESFCDSLPDSCVSLICVDHPYHKVKSEAWDREHGTAAAFLDWTRGMLGRYRRILAPNGSLYVFASTKMGARVEVATGEAFNVLSNIRWRKEEGRHKAAEKEALRAPFDASETIIFAEHYGADNMAKGEAGYAAKCDELRGFVFEPLRAYLVAERNLAGFQTTSAVNAEWQKMRGTKGCMAGHWFGVSQWELPTAENYQWLRTLFNANGGEFLSREYEFLSREYESLRLEYESLRLEYESLRLEYESLRRPFNVSADVPYTDVWDFPTVGRYPGKHPCEKPEEMMEHIVNASSRPGDVVLDCVCGSGTLPATAVKLGRRALACDMSEHWAEQSRIRCEKETAPAPRHTGDLFAPHLFEGFPIP